MEFQNLFKNSDAFDIYSFINENILSIIHIFTIAFLDAALYSELKPQALKKISFWALQSTSLKEYIRKLEMSENKAP